MRSIFHDSCVAIPPRGRFRARPGLVRTAEVALGWGVIRFALWALDQFSRGESAMDVYKFLPNVLSFLGHPAFSGGAIVVGLVLLWLFAKNSEKVSGGVLVHPTTELPLIHPVFPAFRRAVWTCVVASVIAIGICLFYKTSVHLYVMLDSFPYRRRGIIRCRTWQQGSRHHITTRIFRLFMTARS